MFKHQNSINVIISEYIKASNYFLEKTQIKYLNAILDKIAKVLLGKGAKEADTHTVETMLAKLKSDPDYEQLIAPWKETMEKAGKEIPESRVTGYTTLEDKQLARIKELSGNMGNVVMSSGSFVK